MNEAGPMDEGGFRVTGRLVLFSLLGFFAVIIAANAVFITLAVKSFPGEQEKKSYLQGVNFNDALDRRAAQAALGWRATIERVRLDAGVAVIEVSFVDRDGAPVRGLALEGALARAVDDDSDRRLAFEGLGDGRYQATAQGVSEGAWALSVVARRDGAAYAAQDATVPAFEFDARLTIEENVAQ